VKVAVIPPTTEEAAPPPASDDNVGASSHVESRSLAAEVAVLDRARGELASGDANGAIATLEHHAAEFPAGALAAEAELLRIQATDARGDHAGAKALATSFLARFPSSPLAPRVRAILDGAPRSP
jgi:outer membrane protein assembly factor BamD (BamD/ComL family)